MLEAAAVGRGNLNFYHGRPWETNAKVDAGEDTSSLIQKIIPVVINPPVVINNPDEESNKGNKTHEDQRDKNNGRV